EHFRAFRTVNAYGAVLYQKAPPRMGNGEWGMGNEKAPAPPVPAFPDLPSLLPRPVEARPNSPAPPAASSFPIPHSPFPTREDSPFPIRLAAVRAAADRGDWDAALAGCMALLAADRLSPTPHLYHGLILEQVGRHDEAEAALRRAIYL